MITAFSSDCLQLYIKISQDHVTGLDWFHEKCAVIAKLFYSVGDSMTKYSGLNSDTRFVTGLWESGIMSHGLSSERFYKISDKEKKIMYSYADKIRKYNPDYQFPYKLR